MLVVAVAAAAFSFLQVRLARAARKGAVEASARAEDHERKALSAAQRSAGALRDLADATKRAAELQEQSSTAKVHWDIRSLGGGHLRWEIVNQTGHLVDVVVEVLEGGPGNVVTLELDAELDSPTVEPGSAAHFPWQRGSNSRGYIVLGVA